jgi:hypothetical protein
MFFGSQAVMAWIAAIYLIEWHRFKELLIYGILGGYVALLQDQVGKMLGLWQYHDSGVLSRHHLISIVISLSAAPLFAIYFVQGINPDKHAPIPWVRILTITAVAMTPEVIGLYTGHVVYGGGWNIFFSIGAYLLLWLGFRALYRWLQEPRRE